MAVSVGVDRLSVSFQVYDFQDDASFWSTIQDGYRDGVKVWQAFAGVVEIVPGVNAFVGVRRFFEASELAAVYGKLEFNPSRCWDPFGVSLCSAEDTLAALEVALGSACSLVLPVSLDPADCSVKRLDVARDFSGVVSPSATIRGLAPIPRKWARKNLVHADPSKHGAQTLMVGSGAGVVRLYDKAAESGGIAPVGSVRFEAECRSDWCAKYGGIRKASDVVQARVDLLAVDRWKWSAMGATVTSVAGVVDVVANSDLTPRERAMFIGWLVTQGTPHAYNPSKATLAKFRKLQRQFGLAVGTDSIGDIDYSSTLDFQSGLEMVSLS